MSAAFLLSLMAGGAVIALAVLLASKTREAAALAARIRNSEAEIGEKVRVVTEGANKTAAILESMSEGVLVIDADQRVTRMNSSFEKSFGIGRKQVEGSYFWETIRDKDINEMIEEAMKSRRAIKGVHAVSFPDAIFEVQVSPVWNGSEFAGCVAVFFDVSRLQELERLRSEFVANVSHELKTPLTSILGFVETLKEGAIDDAENRGRFLDIIETHSKKLQSLIEDLLFLSKIESEKGPLPKEAFELDKLLDRSIDLFTRPIREKKMRFEKKISAGFTVPAQAVLLERVFSNLLDNAVKYGAPGGRIEVSARREGGEAVVDFANEGPFIGEADLERIFERFYRVDKSRSRESGGTGLGLSIVKHAVERHGGRVSAQNTPSGVVFTVRLPLS